MLLALRAVLEGLVPVSDITEEVDLVLVCEESSSDAVDGCITPPLDRRNHAKWAIKFQKASDIPHNRSHPSYLGNRRTSCRLPLARS